MLSMSSWLNYFISFFATTVIRLEKIESRTGLLQSLGQFQVILRYVASRGKKCGNNDSVGTGFIQEGLPHYKLSYVPYT